MTPWTVACQAPLSMGIPRREYWNKLSFPSPGGLPNSGIKPASPALAGRFFSTEPPGKPLHSQLLAVMNLHNIVSSKMSINDIMLYVTFWDGFFMQLSSVEVHQVVVCVDSSVLFR